MVESAGQCLFCPPLLEEVRVALRNAHCLFLSQPEPVLVGSGIIVPIRHRETVFDLIPEEWEATLALLHDVKALVDREYAPHGYNVGWNCGRIAGQAVFHAHLHVITALCGRAACRQRHTLLAEAGRK